MARKVKQFQAKQAKRFLRHAAAQRGLDREKHFADGGDLTTWRGGAHTVVRNKKKYRRSDLRSARDDA